MTRSPVSSSTSNPSYYSSLRRVCAMRAVQQGRRVASSRFAAWKIGPSVACPHDASSAGVWRTPACRRSNRRRRAFATVLRSSREPTLISIQRTANPSRSASARHEFKRATARPRRSLGEGGRRIVRYAPECRFSGRRPRRRGADMAPRLPLPPRQPGGSSRPCDPASLLTCARRALECDEGSESVPALQRLWS